MFGEMELENKDKKEIVKYDHNTGNIDNSVSEGYESGYTGTVKYGIDRKFIALITFAFLLLIVGIVLIILANINSCETSSTTKLDEPDQGKTVLSDDLCDPSEEARRVNLNEFLIKVQDTYHEVFPEEIAWLPEVTDQIIRNKFKVHDPSPENLRKIWENADSLLKESFRLVSTPLSPDPVRIF